jgi:hypothetical protein
MLPLVPGTCDLQNAASQSWIPPIIRGRRAGVFYQKVLGMPKKQLLQMAAEHGGYLANSGLPSFELNFEVNAIVYMIKPSQRNYVNSLEDSIRTNR